VRNLICARARKRKSFEKNGSYRPGAEYTAFPGEDLAVQAICSAQGVPVAQLTLRFKKRSAVSNFCKPVLTQGWGFY
jgi:hypothetical protein